MKTQFYKPTTAPSQSTQGVQHPKAQRSKLTEEARKIAHERWQAARETYDGALEDAFMKIDSIVQEVATIHHKNKH